MRFSEYNIYLYKENLIRRRKEIHVLLLRSERDVLWVSTCINIYTLCSPSLLSRLIVVLRYPWIALVVKQASSFAGFAW